MFTYICLGTNDLERGIRFYDATLKPLGIERCDVSAEGDWEGWAGWGTYGNGGVQELPLWLCKPFDGHRASVGNGMMIALSATSWAAVDEFHAASLWSCGCQRWPNQPPSAVSSTAKISHQRFIAPWRATIARRL